MSDPDKKTHFISNVTAHTRLDISLSLSPPLSLLCV